MAKKKSSERVTRALTYIREEHEGFIDSPIERGDDIVVPYTVNEIEMEIVVKPNGVIEYYILDSSTEDVYVKFKVLDYFKDFNISESLTRECKNCKSNDMSGCLEENCIHVQTLYASEARVEISRLKRKLAEIFALVSQMRLKGLKGVKFLTYVERLEDLLDS